MNAGLKTVAEVVAERGVCARCLPLRGGALGAAAGASTAAREARAIPLVFEDRLVLLAEVDAAAQALQNVYGVLPIEAQARCLELAHYLCALRRAAL